IQQKYSHIVRLQNY
ncbi:hypothetical protein EC900039_3834B, partial [Escherichia coli 90.0039]